MPVYIADIQFTLYYGYAILGISSPIGVAVRAVQGALNLRCGGVGTAFLNNYISRSIIFKLHLLLTHTSISAH